MADRKAEATRWFRQATFDLEAAAWNAQGGFHDTACFLAQQSAEKALKSFLYYRGARRAALFTHSLVEMIQELADDNAMAALAEDARALDLHYVPSRYPNGLPGGYPHQFYGADLSRKAIAAAGRMIAAVGAAYRAAGETAMLEN